MSEDFEKALRFSLKLLGYRQRSRAELVERIGRKGFKPAVIDKVMGRLSDLGYVDDGAMAASLGRKSREVKLLGRLGARHYLKRMGIDGKTAEEVLSGYDELEVAKRLVERKRVSLGNCPEGVAMRRLAGYLRRRGHSGDTIRKSLGIYKEEAL